MLHVCAERDERHADEEEEEVHDEEEVLEEGVAAVVHLGAAAGGPWLEKETILSGGKSGFSK